MLCRLLLPLVITSAITLLTATTNAAIIVNAARPITHRVTVQLIQTALDNGTSPATVFGTTAQRADIETGIDTIWAQAGIDLYFLPTIVRFNDTFAHQGTSGTNSRSVNDLSTLYNDARAAGGILHSDNTVINMFFVDVVPGFPPLGQSSVAGVAAIAANGTAAFVGTSLIGGANGRDIISTVIAHEIGHNLGLNHASSTSNLMSSGVTSGKLTASQINKALTTTRFVKPLPVELVGDYNNDNVVDGADYVVWRKTLSRIGADLPADGNNNGQIDTGDYTEWRKNFRRSIAGGAAASMNEVPEPSASLLIAALMTAAIRRRRPAVPQVIGFLPILALKTGNSLTENESRR